MRATGRGKGFGYSLGAGLLIHRFPHRPAQTVRAQASRGQARAGTGQLDAPGDLELVAAERHDTDRDARRERLLGNAHAAVAHYAGGAFQHRLVRQETRDAGVGGWTEPRRVLRASGSHHTYGLGGQRLERRIDELAVVLKLGGHGDEHERVFQFREPGRRPGRRVPDARPEQADRGRPVGARVLEELGRHIQHERRTDHGASDVAQWRSAEFHAHGVEFRGEAVVDRE